MAKYKAGQRYRMTGYFCVAANQGEIVVITKDADIVPSFRNEITGATCLGHSESLELVVPISGIFNKKSINKGDKPMGVISKVRELALNKDERLLRKHGVTDECGQRTHQADELLLDILFEQNRDAIVAKVQEVEAEEKAAKK